jgi:prepilin-type N-terminal cleavage/methylation domain-containing protein
MHPKPNFPESGFTLVEVLVAMVVSALLIGILFQGATLARERQAHGQRTISASLLAQSIYAQELNGVALNADKRGTTDGLNWHVRETVILRDPRGFYGLVALQVQIERADGKVLGALSGRHVKRLAP